MEWKNAIVFISSTFNDMHAERDYLIKEVFPELTEWCEDRKIRLTDIDLRWGVTEEESNNSQTIETCLRHVDKSRPFFLCFLGQRRGWIPDFNNGSISKKIDLSNINEITFDYSTDKVGGFKVFIDDEEVACKKISNAGSELEWNTLTLDVSSYNEVILKFEAFTGSINLSKIFCLSNLIFDNNLDGWEYNSHIFLNENENFVSLIASDISDNTQKRYTGIANLDGRSATEMEIEHALLKPIHMFLKEKEYDCPPAKHSLFFFRNPSYVDKLSESQKLIYTNDSEGEESKIKFADSELEKTKQIIRNRKDSEDAKSDSDVTKTNVMISEYSGDWNPDIIIPELTHYDNGEGNGRLINFKCGDEPLKDVLLNQLKNQIALAYPENMEIVIETDLQRDINQQEIFCYLNSEGFIPRPKYTQKLKDYVEYDGGEICLVSAEAGYGKTMLLAKFATDFNENYPNKKLYKRFCGASDLSSDIYSLWKSIMGEAGLSEDEEFYPKNLEELKRNIPEILQFIADKGDCVIIIDAVNQMPDGINMIRWFDEIPDNLKLIISVKEDKNDEIFDSKLQNIKNRNIISGFEIHELDDNDKKDLIKEYLKNYLKSLDEDQIDAICSFEGSKNPLFLKILLAELRVFGSFDQLKEKIQSFGESPVSAFKNVLTRLEKDEEDIKADKLAYLIFSLLANARIGLSENELKTIIQNETGLGEKSIQDAIRLNLRQVRQFMARKEGRHDFFYESFKLAAQEKYADLKIKSNKLLANYFKDNAEFDDNYSFNGDLNNDKDYLRSFNEIPYHLDASKNYEELITVLSSYDFIKNKLELSDINNVIQDYLFSKDHKFNKVEDHPVILIGRSLELSAPVLNEHPEQLPIQLWGRMKGIDDEVIERLLTNVDSSTTDKWLKSNTNTLYSPKSAIIKRIKPEGRKATSAIEITPNKNIINCNEDGMIDIFDMNLNELEVLDKGDSKIVKLIPEDNALLIAYADGTIKKWDMINRMVIKDDYPKIDAEITDIYLSKTYKKIYVSSHTGIFSIDVDTNELRKEAIEAKNYNQILVPRRNEAILVCDEKEVDGWDVYEMRKAYNKHHQQNDDEDSSTKIDTSEEIRFMGLNKRFLTLISENGQMKFWNTLKNSGGGESIDEAQVCSPNDKFRQAKTLEDENEIITISDMGVLRVWDIPQPRSPKFGDPVIDIQTGIKSPTAIDYYNDGTDRWVIVGNKNNDVSVIDLKKEIEEDKTIRHAESVLSIKIDDNHMITASDNGEIFTWDKDSEQFINRYSNDFRCNSLSYNREDKKLIFAGVKAEKDGKKTYKIADCDITDEMWQANDMENNEAIPLEVDEKINSEEIIDIAQNSSGMVFLEKNKLVIGSDETNFDKVATTLTTKFDSGEVFVGFEDGSIAKYPGEVSFDKPVQSSVTKIKVTDDDKLIAGYEDGSLELFSLEGTHNSADGLKHEKAVTNIDVISNSEIATVSEDNTLKFWDIETGKCTYTYFLDIYATAINVDGDKLVVGDALGNVRFYYIENS